MPKANTFGGKNSMKLFLITTEKNIYATNGDTRELVYSKFKKVYPEYLPIKISEIPVESLVRMEDNDSIIFF